MRVAPLMETSLCEFCFHPQWCSSATRHGQKMLPLPQQLELLSATRKQEEWRHDGEFLLGGETPDPNFPTRFCKAAAQFQADRFRSFPAAVVLQAAAGLVSDEADEAS
mmetsp:Transcript_53150/g.126824  ORF Transcript_53150/g.126824 Transcript_53150/m.126824 type:complete len:108 (+) Transcript_53150:755-1078(+)